MAEINGWRGLQKFGGTENGADCSKCGGTVAVLFKTRNGTSLMMRNLPLLFSSAIQSIGHKDLYLEFLRI